MGSSLSPVLASLFLEQSEKEALASRTLKRKLCIRYEFSSTITQSLKSF